MHLKFSGELANALLNQHTPNKRAHAALVNVFLKQAMDHYITQNSNSGLMTVTPAIGGLLREANGLDTHAYTMWVATVAGELVLDPEKYAKDGYTIPWEAVSQPFLMKVWQKGDDLAELPF